MKLRLTILPTHKTVNVPAGTLVADALRLAGIALDMPCGGQGTCGKCRVKLNGSCILACQTKLQSDSVVEVSCQSDSDFALQTKACSSDCLGVAVDIGTTTVETRLIEIESGAVLATLSELNAQQSFGADVISRIHFEQTHSKTGREELTGAIVRQVQNLIDQYCGRLSIRPERIKRVSVTGNTAMLTWFVGQSGLSLGSVPFQPAIPVTGQVLPAENLGLNLPGAQVIVPPVIGGFLGGDILGVIDRCLKAERSQKNRSWLALDVGTNGEMAIFHNGTLAAASTAAGPALEGAGISIGTKAGAGAVNSVRVNEDGELVWTTLNDSAPTGVCGSGLIDLIACLLKTGQLLPKGKLRIPPAAPLNITQKDVRQVQLACGAIRTGVLALLECAGLTMADLDAVYIAGNFGCHLSVTSLFDVGILPPGRPEQVQFLGNLALDEAADVLLHPNVLGALSELNQTARSVKAINLAELPDFTDRFTHAMKFPSPESSA
ncbi:MAG: DUF4445 domain-containing protein [Thermoguttaceae bacterium]|nr:DUF4445 domain-containing protein [Thermoguttaceae bacterium]